MYTSREFNDIDEMVQNFSSQWDLKFCEFEPIKSSSYLRQLTLTNIQITNALFSGKSLLTGGTPNVAKGDRIMDATFYFSAGKYTCCISIEQQGDLQETSLPHLVEKDTLFFVITYEFFAHFILVD